jgi:cytochrome P450
LAANTLLGSLARSLAHSLDLNPSTALSKIVWDEDFSTTGLPAIERVAACDTELGGFTILKGQRVRLMLDAAGFGAGSQPSFDPIYFALGPHRCPGANPSRSAWKALTAELAKYNVILGLNALRVRTPDTAFILPERMDVTVHV